MNGIKGLTLLAVSLAGLMILAGCAGGGRVEGEGEGTATEDDNNGDEGGGGGTVGGTVGGTGEADDDDNDTPGFGAALIVAGLGLASVWTARRLRK